MKTRNILIFGGEFFNKGAQAMSFITISRLKDQFPNHEIILISDADSRRDKDTLDKYSFTILPDPFGRGNFIGENILRKILRKELRVSPKVSKKLLNNTEYIFDISGYALSSQFGEKYSKDYLKKFDEAKIRGIKTVIMPQSIGPFDYSDKTLIDKIKSTLSSVDLIMPREKQGKMSLEKLGITENVQQNADMVLTSKEKINWKNIYKEIPEKHYYDIEDSSIMIIPNAMNFRHGNTDVILELYKNAITILLNSGKSVYLVKHSASDSEAVTLIKEEFKTEEKVRVILDDMTPEEFEELAKKFEFNIASRFHSVVHSYKVETPCLILGWANKYIELSKMFNQENYVFDVRNNINQGYFVEQLNEMIVKHNYESETIHKKFEEIVELSDPFDFVFNHFETTIND